MGRGAKGAGQFGAAFGGFRIEIGGEQAGAALGEAEQGRTADAAGAGDHHQLAAHRARVGPDLGALQGRRRLAGFLGVDELAEPAGQLLRLGQRLPWPTLASRRHRRGAHRPRCWNSWRRRNGRGSVRSVAPALRWRLRGRNRRMKLPRYSLTSCRPSLAWVGLTCGWRTPSACFRNCARAGPGRRSRAARVRRGYGRRRCTRVEQLAEYRFQGLRTALPEVFAHPETDMVQAGPGDRGIGRDQRSALRIGDAFQVWIEPQSWASRCTGRSGLVARITACRSSLSRCRW